MVGNSKRILAIAMAGVLLVGSAATGLTDSNAASKVKISKNKLTLGVGESTKLSLKNVKKKKAKKATWKSSNTKVATVKKKAAKAVVTAVGTGKATITAKLAGKKYTCKVTVTDPYAGVKKFLKNAEGIKSVEEIKQDPSNQIMYARKYLLTFEQPLDYKNPSAGTFPQRVVLGLKDDAMVNVLETQGYCLQDKQGLPFTKNAPSDADTCLGANDINIEHRFFGDSRPADMTNTETKYWEYHTAENAANDYHRIYTTLAPLLGEKWVASGVSRGGEMTNVYGYFFPDDMDVYMPYVAPCMTGLQVKQFYENVYTTIGDDRFGKEEAKKRRDLLMSFQVELMKNKADILPYYEKYIANKGLTYQPQVKTDVLFDISVLEFAAQIWQYDKWELLNQAGGIENVMAMPETTADEKANKLIAELTLLITGQGPEDWSVNGVAWPYYVNAATTYGQYHYSFSYLREAMEKAGVANTLSVTPEMEDGLLQSLVFNDAQRTAFTYDDTFVKALVNSVKTTTAKHLMIYGLSDPWYAVRIPDATDNPNVKIFVNPNQPHSAGIANMPEDMQADIIKVLREWLELG